MTPRKKWIALTHFKKSTSLKKIEPNVWCQFNFSFAQFNGFSLQASEHSCWIFLHKQEKLIFSYTIKYKLIVDLTVLTPLFH